MIRLYNSLTQSKEELVPREQGKVGIYVCGPTVYNLIHVGNARPYVIFAVLRSWLQHRGYAVTLVENITDVDDKIINKANAEGRSPTDVAAEYTATYLQDTERLGILRPDLEPKATETIPEIIDLVCQLVAQGHAYEAQGSVYFRVRSFAEYGKLSRQRIEELEEGVRVEAEPGKQDPLDFAVWKAAKAGEPAWESPWGMGRPGWHIECSAMGLRYLGPGFDIHGGGRDLIFPHHENEVAQSEAAGLPFARLWMHNGMIRTAGAKMAKSVGNIFLLREVLDVYPPPVVLMYFLTTHYRSPLEFSLEKLDEAKAAYEHLADAVGTARFRVETAASATAIGANARLADAVERARSAFAERMDNDLNTAGAIGELFALVGDMHRHLEAVDAGTEPLDPDGMAAVADTLGGCCELLLIPLPTFPEAAATTESSASAVLTPKPPAVSLSDDEALATWSERLAGGDALPAARARDLYRSRKEWGRADEIRDALQTAGFEVRDTKQGTQVVRKG